MAKWLAVLSLCLGIVACGGGGSSDGAAACGPANCTGCCFNGACQVGSANAACGSAGLTCSACAAHRVCLPAQACGLDPAQLWDVLLVAATVKATNNGAAWDGDGSAPDPYGVFPDASLATSAKLDTYSATWTPGEGVAASAAFLTGTGFEFQLLDDDLLTPDPITAPLVVFLEDADFSTGAYSTGPVDGAQSVTFSIAKHVGP